MEIIQQKLIWFLGLGSVLIILLRLKFGQTVADKQVSTKIISGIFLIIFGTVFGIYARVGMLDHWISKSGVAFYIENIFGYMTGWCFVIWGLLEWSHRYFDKKGNPLNDSRSRFFGEKISEGLLKSHDAASFLEYTSRHILMALKCQGLAFHKISEGGNLYLAYQNGLTPESQSLVLSPSQGSFFDKVLWGNRAISTDEPSALHFSGTLATESGLVACALGTPIFSDGPSALLTVFDNRKRHFKKNEIGMLQAISAALETMLKKDKIAIGFQRELKFRDMLMAVSFIFEKGHSLTSAVLKAARIIHGFMPYYEINLYISGDGRVDTLKFDFPSGGRLNLLSGHLKRREYPHLFATSPVAGESGSDISRDLYESPERQSMIKRISAGPRELAWMEIRMGAGRNLPPYLSHLLTVMGLGIARKINEETITRNDHLAGQWLGAIKYFQERASITSNLSELLQEAANIVINSNAAAFCRISLCNPDKIDLKTAALAQVRSLKWPMQQLNRVETARTEFHRRALLNCAPVHFDQEDNSLRISKQEAAFLLPEGAKRGIILPLVIGKQAVGLVTAGEFRDLERLPNQKLAEMFLEDLGALISAILTWHKDKRISGEAREGHRRLTVVQKESRRHLPALEFSPKIRSRINGPLAGILASCEYLKDNPEINTEVGKFLNVIERNAVKIHEIAAGI